MPGHKGQHFTGAEPEDITEINGADSLYESVGIIQESERHASALFGTAATLYSTEGSSQGIRAMLYLARLYAQREGKEPRILAARNVHKTFITAVGLLDMEIDWLSSESNGSYLSCVPSLSELEYLLQRKQYPALYVTSPDYLGNLAPIDSLAQLCHRYGTLLLVDNAHGAYLKFLPSSAHPMDLGADLCCDSAHKTLPALTGAAYLHLSERAPTWMAEEAKNAMALFGSTSPSYLILQSLDRLNAYLTDGYAEKLAGFLPQAAAFREKWAKKGYQFLGNEPMKLTLATKSVGYQGQEFAALLEERHIVCEFSDPDYVVLMLSCELGGEGLSKLSAALNTIERKEPILTKPPKLSLPERVTSVRNAIFSASEWVPTEEACGRILAALTLSCPPAVPIAVCGERIDENALALFRYYGIQRCRVMCEESSIFPNKRTVAL